MYNVLTMINISHIDIFQVKSSQVKSSQVKSSQVLKIFYNKKLDFIFLLYLLRYVCIKYRKIYIESAKSAEAYDDEKSKE